MNPPLTFGRRDFLRQTGGGFGALALSHLLGGDAEAAPSNRIFLDNIRIFSQQQYAPQETDK